MAFIECLKQAISSLRSNKLRTFLTMLGIIMGVFSIVTIVAISDAAKLYMSSQFDKLGAKTISVQAGNKMGALFGGNFSASTPLKLSDMDLIKRIAPETKSIVASSQTFGKIKYNNYTNNAILTGVTSQYRNFTTVDINQGRFFTDTEVTNTSPVILISEDAAIDMFGANNPIGKTIDLTIGKKVTRPFVIVGTFDYENSMSGMMGDNFPAICLIPLTTAQAYNDTLEIQSISLTVNDSNADIKDISSRIEKFLNFSKGTSDAYSVTTSEDTMATVDGILNVVSMVLLVIAIITLIVGGIGIVNILLVSVTERIREIGIRKALGAKNRDIVMQFLTESIIMTGIGGLFGILLGVGSGAIIATLIQIQPAVNFPVLILAFIGSIALGLLFGVYPAKRASALDPIEALRYE